MVNPASTFSTYTRASASDFDDWAKEGWPFKDLLPLAKESESVKLFGEVDASVHGFDGPLEVSFALESRPSWASSATKR